jgi:zinc protease
MDGLDGGYFGTYIGCSPEKVDKAVAMMKSELQRLVETKVPDEEVERAKRSLLGRHDIGLQKNSSVANEMVLNTLYGLPYDEYLTYGEKFKSITGKDIQTLAAQLFSQSSVLSIVGPE